MPVTPLHLGPGTVFKAIVGKRMSMTVFAFSQVMMDIEVLGRIALDSERLHGFTNTIGGATFILLPSVLIGRPVCEAFLVWWNRNLDPAQRTLFSVEPSISWQAAWIGGILGVYSHWFLDAMMHADARALWPFAEGNPFITWLSISGINVLCIAALGLGCGLLFALLVWGKILNRADTGA
jgi:hypothetical protein